MLQIYKKDSYIEGQKCFCDYWCFNNVYMIYVLMSLFYLMFVVFDVNVQMYVGLVGKCLWCDCVVYGVDVCKLLLKICCQICLFVLQQVDGCLWVDYLIEQIVDDLCFFCFYLVDMWYGFDGYVDDQYFVDLCKLLLMMFGIDCDMYEYVVFGVLVLIFVCYLCEYGVVFEKVDLYMILFLFMLLESFGKLQYLVVYFVQFECYFDQDMLLCEVILLLCEVYLELYGMMCLWQLCQCMYDFYCSYDMKYLQKQMFWCVQFLKQVMLLQVVNVELICNNVEFVMFDCIEGWIVIEGVLFYLLGIFCVVLGEVWGGLVFDYFCVFEVGINVLLGFELEIQGVYLQMKLDGIKQVLVYVVVVGVDVLCMQVWWVVVCCLLFVLEMIVWCCDGCVLVFVYGLIVWYCFFFWDN